MVLLGRLFLYETAGRWSVMEETSHRFLRDIRPGTDIGSFEVLKTTKELRSVN